VALLGLIALLLAGCASTGGAPVQEGFGTGAGPVPDGYYRVRRGDSLSEIAQRRHLRTKNLIRWNGLKPPYNLEIGQVLRVRPPVRGRATARGGRTTDSRVAAAGVRRKVRGGTRPRAAPVVVERGVPGSRARVSGVTWVWPLGGAVLQPFRTGDPARQGVRIGCRAGEAVHAAAAGQVVYSGSGLKGYGNLIIIKHDKNYLSAYGFNRRLFLKEGDTVKRGQAVSECGQGPDGAYLLHFEVRRDGSSVNPILYLPPRA
jgi:lipoprotein NlpD